MRIALWFPAFVLAVFAGCVAGDGSSPTPPGDPGWSSMNYEERKEYMEDVVQAEMRPLFREFNSTRYPRLQCVECHNDDAEAVNYEMPNGIEPLFVDNLPSRYSTNAATAAMVAFMEDQVTPTMAALLGYKVGEPDGLDFDCFDCHGKR